MVLASRGSSLHGRAESLTFLTFSLFLMSVCFYGSVQFLTLGNVPNASKSFACLILGCPANQTIIAADRVYLQGATCHIEQNSIEAI